jgi:DNA-binding transcriptional MerR regulator
MTIGELAERAGSAPSAIRSYEKAGVLEVPPRVDGRRVYHEEAVHQLVIICLAKATGLRLREIKLLLRGLPPKTTASARWKKMARGEARGTGNHPDEAAGDEKSFRINDVLPLPHTGTMSAGLTRSARKWRA